MKGTLLILAAAVLWGTTGTTQAFAPEGASPIMIGALRLLIGGLTLLIIAITTRAFKPNTKWPFFPTAIGIIGVAAYQICFFYGVAFTGVAVGTIVAIGSAPAIAGVMSALIFKETLGIKWIISTILAVIGGTLLVLSGTTDAVSINLVGILLSLGAGASYTLYTMSSKSLLRTHHADAVMAVLFFGAAICLTPVFFTGNIGWMSEPKGWISMLHLGVFATAVAYMFFSRGLKSVPVSKTATLSLGEPFTAAILGILVLGETISFQGQIGIGLLFSGLIILSLDLNISTKSTK